MKEITINSQAFENLLFLYSGLIRKNEISPKLMSSENLKTLANISQKNDRIVFKANNSNGFYGLSHISYYFSNLSLEPADIYETLESKKQNFNDGLFIAINSIESFSKGTGKNIIQFLYNKNNVNGLFLVPKNEGLKNYYLKLGFDFVHKESDVMYIGKN